LREDAQPHVGSELEQEIPLVFTQRKPAQHATCAEQFCPSPGQLPLWQVPVVLPDGTLQDKPEQQSAVAVQTPLKGWQTAGARQAPLAQICEQQLTPASQLVPLAKHAPPPSGIPASEDAGGTWQA